jgi:hypothetical protein
MPFPTGTGEGVVLTDKTCQRKAIFVTAGDGITIRSLAFARGRVPNKNGAGIRVERKDFTIEHSRFINNENGILTTEAPEHDQDQRQRVLTQRQTRLHTASCRLRRIEG